VDVRRSLTRSLTSSLTSSLTGRSGSSRSGSGPAALLGRRPARAIALLLALLLAVFFLYPVLRVLARGVAPSVIADVLSDSRIRSVAWFSLWQAGASTIAAAALAIPIAVVFSRYEFPGRRVLLGVLSAPFTLPSVVLATSILVLAPRSLQRTATLIICAHILYNTGFLARALAIALERSGSNSRDAAQTLGASPLRSLVTVELPMIAATLRRSLGVVFSLCFASFGTVLILGGPRRSTLDVEVHRQVFQFGRVDRSAAVALLQLVVLAVVLVASQAGRRDHAAADRRRSARETPRTTAAIASVAAVWLAVVATITAPLAGVVKRAFRNVDGTMGIENFRALGRMTRGSGLLSSPAASIALSLRTALLVSIAAAVVSVLAALVASHQRLQALPRLLSLLPLVTSPITLGLGVVLGFASSPIAWRTSPLMIVCVQTIVCLPFTLATVLSAARSIPQSFVDAAATLGAAPSQIRRTVWLPLLRPTLVAASGLAFAVALGEFGAASILVRPSSETMPVVIARLAAKPGVVLSGQAAALACILALFTAIAASLTVVGRDHS
jgi:thiamine transport system permease protein